MLDTELFGGIFPIILFFLKTWILNLVTSLLIRMIFKIKTLLHVKNNKQTNGLNLDTYT